VLVLGPVCWLGGCMNGSRAAGVVAYWLFNGGQLREVRNRPTPDLRSDGTIT
jgi:hypothetical protein